MEAIFSNVETRAIVAALVVTVLIVALFIAGRRFAGLTDTTVYVAAIAIGLIVYCIVSGRLTEFSAGGFGGKLNVAINTKVNILPGALKAVRGDMPEMQPIPKGDLSRLREILPKLTESHPIVLSLKFGSPPANNATVVQNYLEALGQFRSFRLVLFNDNNNVLKAYIPASAFVRLLQNPQDAERFIQLVNDGSDQIKSFPSVTNKTISLDATYLMALTTMEQDGLDALVVIDANGQPAGVLERKQVITKLLLTVANSSR